MGAGETGLKKLADRTLKDEARGNEHRDLNRAGVRDREQRGWTNNTHRHLLFHKLIKNTLKSSSEDILPDNAHLRSQCSCRLPLCEL